MIPGEVTTIYIAETNSLLLVFLHIHITKHIEYYNYDSHRSNTSSAPKHLLLTGERVYGAESTLIYLV